MNTTKIQELEIQVAKYRAEAETWEKAFNQILCTVNQCQLRERATMPKSKKTVAENFEDGKKFASMFLIPHKEEFPAKGEIGVQSA
jgi:hypothetical protein